MDNNQFEATTIVCNFYFNLCTLQNKIKSKECSVYPMILIGVKSMMSKIYHGSSATRNQCLAHPFMEFHTVSVVQLCLDNRHCLILCSKQKLVKMSVFFLTTIVLIHFF